MIKKFNKKVKVLGAIGMMLIAFPSFFVSACKLTPVSGKIIGASEELGDNSDWMEIAKYDQYSLILRINCLPEKVTYSDGQNYCGYTHSNVDIAINNWFSNLEDSCKLKRFSVGSDALANLGWYEPRSSVSYHTLKSYQYDTPGEERGVGFSMPKPDKKSSAFALSCQEARKFIGGQLDSKRTEPSAHVNYSILNESRKAPNYDFFGFCSRFKIAPLGEHSLCVEPSWLRSPGEDISCASFHRDRRMFDTIVSIKVSTPLGVRPAMWVKSSLLDQTLHPMDKFDYELDVRGDEVLKTKIKNLLLCEKKYMDESENKRNQLHNVRYHIALNGKANPQFLKSLVNVYHKLGVISKNQIIEFSSSNFKELSKEDLIELLKSKINSSQGGVLLIDCDKVLEEPKDSKDLKSIYDDFLDTLIQSNCLIILENFRKPLDEYVNSSFYYRDMFETLEVNSQEETKPDNNPHSFTAEECLKPLESLVGMTDFKDLMKTLLHDFKVFKIDEKLGITRKYPKFHMVLMGNSGTGKTTVAKMMGDILFKAGVIQENKVVKVERADLVGKYQGHTEAFVRDKLNEAKGGILFIDEAYSLSEGGKRDFGQRAIEGLLSPLDTNDSVIIVAGYPDEMKKFLSSNSGLSGRFSHKVVLKDYSPEELLQIFENLCFKSNFVLEENAKKELIEIFKCPNCENARYVHKIYDSVMQQRSLNIPEDVDINSISEDEKANMKTIKSEYVEAVKEKIKK